MVLGCVGSSTQMARHRIERDLGPRLVALAGDISRDISRDIQATEVRE